MQPQQHAQPPYFQQPMNPYQNNIQYTNQMPDQQQPPVFAMNQQYPAQQGPMIVQP